MNRTVPSTTTAGTAVNLTFYHDKLSLKTLLLFKNRHFSSLINKVSSLFRSDHLMVSLYNTGRTTTTNLQVWGLIITIDATKGLK